MRWFVHIGAPKTGSTAIQRFLCENRDALLGQGFHYPDVSLRGFGHHDFAFLLNGGYPTWASPQPRSLAALVAELGAAVTAREAHTVVLSSENFYIYPRPAELRGLMRSAGMRDGDELRIVCYLRRQDEAHVSWYNQTVKAQGNAGSFEASIRRDYGLWDYADRLKPWQEEFGTAAVVVRDYAPFRVAPGDVRVDFLALLGASPVGLDLPPARVNERLNRDVLRFQRLVNRLPLPTARKRRYHKQLIALTAATADLALFDDSPFLSDGRRDELLRSYAESNSLVARTFLGRNALFEPVTSAGDTVAPHARRGLGPAKLAFILKWILTHRKP